MQRAADDRKEKRERGVPAIISVLYVTRMPRARTHGTQPSTIGDRDRDRDRRARRLGGGDRATFDYT